ncbi:MAG TPA: PEP-CTERM sorting domain-containing protein [Candidatus Solibacter sp.]|nr:PEP-CTERM sorting domain-containing protein [Candidatus Solibacter sp.]
MRVPKAVPRVLLAGIGILLLTLFTQSAKADVIYLDFACSGAANCGGSVVTSSGDYSTTGINLVEGSGFYTGSALIASAPFTLVFNTATPGAISLDGTLGETGENFVGTITGFSATPGFNQTNLTLVVLWTTLPADVSAYFAPLGNGGSIGSIIDLSTSGTVTSADFTITPTPEPASVVMLLVGLLGLGLAMKRKAAVLT